MSVGLRIDPDGNFEALPDLTYTTIRDAVDGWLEGVATDGSCTIYCDEEGKLKRLPVNPVASVFWMTHGGMIPASTGDLLVGPVVLVGPPDREGNDTRLALSMVDQVAAISVAWLHRGPADIADEIKRIVEGET